MLIENKPIKLFKANHKTDNELSLWLKSKGWKGDYIRHNTPVNSFILPNHNFLCDLKYDNKSCTYEIFVNQNMLEDINNFMNN